MSSWPNELYLITHAQCDASSGGMEREAGLTALGMQQAGDLGRWLARHSPRSIWSSPFRCARDTARLALRAAGMHAPVIVDERLALADPSQMLHDAASLADALRACAYERLALVTHRAVVVALSSIIERVPIAQLTDRDRRDCAMTEYRRVDGRIARIA